MTTGHLRPDQNYDVLILIDDIWHPGELRGWEKRADGSWWANIQWRLQGGKMLVTGTFPADRVRPNGTIDSEPHVRPW